ncbi:MAG: hypothetical protein K6T65_05745 [Peptococcaceae bacterium]|nr:hypothetical protein [Peptococcaceae bacterium]
MKAAGVYRSISLLIIGIILGAVGTTVYIGSQLEYLTLANKELRDQLADAQFNLAKLKETSDMKKKHIIDTVETFLLMDSTEGLTDYDKLAVELEAGKKVKDLLNPIIGQDVAGLDSLLIPRIVDNREIEANGNRYRLRTYLVVVNQKTTVYTKAYRLKSEEKAK